MNILHATILNPANHTRIRKIVLCQVEAGHQVMVIGKKDTSKPHAKVIYHFTGKTNRSWLARLITHFKASYYFLKNLSSIDLLWIHTPELFYWAWIARWKGKKVVYDVHEDYYENIAHAEHYGSWYRQLLAQWVRKIERSIAKFAFVVYSEHAYVNLLEAERFDFLPNRFDRNYLPDLQASPWQNHPSLPIQLVISGTLAAEWGVEEAITFWEAINHHGQPATLKIVGFCTLPTYAINLRKRIALSPYKHLCELHGIEEYLPYETVLKHIAQSDIVLAPYKPLKKFIGKVPTKFYEAMALQKPILFTAMPHWVRQNEHYRWGMPIQDWSKPIDLQQLKHWQPQTDESLYLWDCKQVLNITEKA